MRLVTNGLNNIRQRIVNKFTLSERFRSTFVERWMLYCQHLITDYTNVSIDLVKKAYTKPKKALVYGVCTYGLYNLIHYNPDEEAFMHEFRIYRNRMICVAPTMQNPVSTEYLLMLERAINQNKLRLLSLGVCTLLWIDLYDKDDCTYEANCEYTKVDIWDFYKHIVDIGIWNHFWRLRWKMINYDINYL